MAERIGTIARRVLERLERNREPMDPPKVAELATSAIRYAKDKDGAQWSRDVAINWALSYQSSLSGREFFAVKQTIQKAWNIRHYH